MSWRPIYPLEDEPQKKLHKCRWLLAILVIIIASLVIATCTQLLGYIHIIVAGFNYDPVQVAIEQTRQYIEAVQVYEEPGPHNNPVHPGGEWPHYCWELLRTPAIESSNNYTLTVVYVSQDGSSQVGGSGGDEVEVEVDFSNGSRVVVNYYVDEVRYCYIPHGPDGE